MPHFKCFLDFIFEISGMREVERIADMEKTRMKKSSKN